MIATQPESRISAISPIHLLILIAGLNLNGLAFVLTGKEGLLSVLTLVISLYATVKYARFSYLTRIYGLFVFFMLVLIVSGAIGNIHYGQINMKMIIRYAATILFVSACYFWFMGRTEEQLRSALQFIKIVLLVSCVSVIFSDSLNDFLGIPSSDRKTGIFLHPGNAAMAALYCLILTVNFPSKKTAIIVIQFLIILLAIFLTFSKTGLLLLLPLSALYLIHKRSFSYLFLGMVVIVLVAFAFWYVTSYDPSILSHFQKLRLQQFMNILNGHIDESSTTHRSELWRLGLRKISLIFPWGSGHGTFHMLQGGVRDNVTGAWQGIHNTFLMILGEAGLATLIIFILFWISAIWNGSRSPYPYNVLSIGFAIVLLGDMSGAHATLTLRLLNLFIAFLITFAAMHQQGQKTLSRDRLRTSGTGIPAIIQTESS